MHRLTYTCMHIYIIEHTYQAHSYAYSDWDNSLPGTLALINFGSHNCLSGDFRLASKKLIRKGGWLLGHRLTLYPSQCVVQLH